MGILHPELQHIRRKKRLMQCMKEGCSRRSSSFPSVPCIHEVHVNVENQVLRVPSVGMSEMERRFEEKQKLRVFLSMCSFFFGMKRVQHMYENDIKRLIRSDEVLDTFFSSFLVFRRACYVL